MTPVPRSARTSAVVEQPLATHAPAPASIARKALLLILPPSSSEFRKRFDHFRRRLHQFDQHTLASNRKFLAGLRVQKTDVVAGGALAAAARGETHALRCQPCHGLRQ